MSAKKYFEREYYQVRFTPSLPAGTKPAKDSPKLQAWRFRTEDEAMAKFVELTNATGKKGAGTISCTHYTEKVWSEALSLQDLREHQGALVRGGNRHPARFQEEFDEELALQTDYDRAPGSPPPFRRGRN